ncbi:MAG: potassium channel protein [Thermosipho sp. (in: Bacteria)]|nr:potassium channel protein [Thermosipho sp. (in: thermotogales)]
MNEYSNLGKVIIRQIIILTTLVILVLLSGVFYYYYFENFSIEDAFFFTAITISTVGYGMPENLSNGGKIFTSILIFAGISVVLYGVSTITAIIVEGKLKDFLKRRRIRRMIDKMKDHIIVVGAGKTGEYVISELIKEKEKFVVIDIDEEKIQKIINLFENTPIAYVIGDATEEEILKEAGIEKAKALITTLSEDSINVFVVLSAKTLNPDLTIVSKVTDVSSIKKLKYAGATTVVAANEIAGTRMARLTIKPHAVNFLDIVAFGKQSYRIEEIFVEDNSPLTGKTIAELNLAKNYQIMVLGINRNGEIYFAPTGDSMIQANDKLIILGDKEHIEKFREFAKL